MLRNTFATTDLLYATPSSTNVVKTLVYFSDKIATAYTGGNEPHSLAAASKATICGTPASGVRDIDHVIICATGGANTIIVGQTVSGTDYQITQAVLATNETLEYTHAHGWVTIDANGALKTTQGSWTIAAGKAGTLSNSLTLAGTDGTTMTFPTTSATIARTDAGNTFTGNNIFTNITTYGVSFGPWASTHKGIQLSTEDSIVADNSNTLLISQNAYYNGGWKYIEAGTAANMYYGGGIFYRVAAAGVNPADPITWIDSLSIGVTGGVYIGSATGGDKGANTINTAGYYSNGTAGVSSFGPAAVASITVKNGIVTAIS